MHRPDAFDPDTTNEAEFLEKYQAWWKLLADVTREAVDANDVRCPVTEYADKMRAVSCLFPPLLRHLLSHYFVLSQCSAF